jgi:hypothetical protein
VITLSFKSENVKRQKNSLKYISKLIRDATARVLTSKHPLKHLAENEFRRRKVNIRQHIMERNTALPSLNFGERVN